jgi:hypothetical protein
MFKSVRGIVVLETKALKPGRSMSALDQVSMRNIKSILLILLGKSLFIILSPNVLCERPWMFHVLSDILECIYRLGNGRE